MDVVFEFLAEEALSIVVSVFAPIVLGFVVGWLYQQAKLVKAMIPAETQAMLENITERLVLAAEQKGLAGIIRNIGAEKKQYVIDRMEAILASKGLNVDLDFLDDLIEAALWEAINQYKVPKPVVEPFPVSE